MSNLSLELCQKLKEAGFPQKIQHGDWFYNEELEFEFPMDVRCDYCDDEAGLNSADYEVSAIIKIPTLSELIEACGESISHVKRWNGNWWAVSNECEHSKKCDCINNIEEMSATPEEAVANLWLALNKM